jgi:hypothetical protein
MRLRMLRRGLALGLLLSGFAFAQTAFQFQMRLSLAGQTFVIQNQSTIPFSTSTGQTEIAQVQATYVGSGKITVSSVPQIFGSTEFTSNLTGKLPLTLNPGDSFTFTITFAPTSATTASAVLTLPFTETIPGVGNQNPTTTTNAISFQLLGSAASFVESYIKDGNTFALPNGGTMLFDPQPINTSVTLQLNVTNTGSAAGQVTAFSVSGKAFKALGTPLLPVTIPAGNVLPLAVQYSPTAVGTDTGQVQLSFSDGTTFSATLQGSGITSTLAYSIIVNGKTTTITPGGTMAFPDTNIGSTASATVHVQNTGAASTTITSINVANVSGQAFALSPLVLPKTLNQNDSLSFTITFAPTAPGIQTATLFVDNDSFTLSGKGLGSQLQFSYSAAGSTQIIGQNGVAAVVFSPIQVTQSGSIPFTVTNTGTLSTVISNITIGETPSPFSISGAPAKLPASLAPGKSISFLVKFAPTTSGVSNGTLLVNSTSVQLTGSASTPPALPTYTISGPTGNVAPQSQPSVSLTLSSPYPLALNGVLTLTTSGTLGTDPAVQFQTGNVQTGGRTVAFTIPANGTQANFAGQGTQILLQTGTVAETITLTPSFTTSSGVDLTPANPATLQFTVPSSAPVLIAGVETASAANVVVLSFTGYSTTRNLTTLNVQFTAATGFTLSGGQVSVDLSPEATVWFDSTGSQSFGGQFTVSVPFTFSGTVPKGDTLLQTIASFSATISNSVGASNSVSGPIQ